MSEAGIVREPAPRRPVRDGLVLGAWVLAILLILSFWGTLVVAFGADPIPWIAVMVVFVGPAFLLAMPVHRLLTAYLDEPPSYWILGLVSFVLVVALAGSVLNAANQRYEADLDVAASACSPQELQALQGLPFYVKDTTPITGLRDGSCTLTAPTQASGATAVDTVAAELTQAGWTASGEDADGRTFTRTGTTVVVTPGATDAKGVTTVTLTIPPD